MNNLLTVIVPIFNAESYIEKTIKSLEKQTYQDFNLIIINDGSTDQTDAKLQSALGKYNKELEYIKLNQNQGHAYARNVGISKVYTPYFMFLDADDTLMPYTIETYMNYVSQSDVLFSKIDNFTLDLPVQNVDSNLVIAQGDVQGNEAFILKQHSASNFVFRTDTVKKFNITFNTTLSHYADWSFLIDYLKHISTYTFMQGLPFYHRGEVFDPFLKQPFSNHSFADYFPEYVRAFKVALKKSFNGNIQQFLLNHMLTTIRKDMDPNHKDIQQRYRQIQHTLSDLSRTLRPVLKKEKAVLFKIEMRLLNRKWYKLAWKMNRFRYFIRLMKIILLRRPQYHLAQYRLFNSPKSVLNNTIVFESFGGKHYSDSPKYVYEYMKKTYPQLNYYWIFKDINDTTLPSDIQKIQKGSSDYYKIFKKARVWVSNSRLPLYLEKKSNQTYIQTWHGTPLKRLANDMKQVRLPGTTTELYKRNFYAATRRWDYLISPNSYSTEIFQSAFWMDKDKILEVGYPRNDILVNHEHDVILQQQVKDELHIPKDKKVVLYAPTWRDDEYKEAGHYTFDLPFDLQQFYEQFGDTHVILLRMHYFISNQLSLKGYEDFAIDVSNYNDISKLYLISDCLITDYSSVMFDYGILKRPQLFFPYDIEKYASELRGFYINYHTDLPGPIYTNPDALIEGLKNIDQIRETYQDKIEAFHQRFCSNENGRASQYIGDMIYNEIQKSLD
ncbi:bifunctional glycosyltransferase family 2 protein/CDP-glycerol:glycerophosphate glycerophosphotransferase [Staphylococcus ursi]|uniref:bifunctional glycosyltransferase family 2 protein/CDP-glycerol:glycerophosphate glycerophosphotransferase n=1 Tax=Staphylococcus sp. MI 10-1553 TaxID=1912064 RepID=UPI0013990CDD|nr:bifunctional glycosyltransferase family 2 protein/CDP-glycerol:glycerophosphate glycerophosphotransferase [Staphylococcus sp. MI 10-1553]QHW36262.1 bifunctional glycosyltransferase family 2 protein/CDP-glycerol:glycerophosphate glycerophosphotransferase [Staphylococcus sp. MI 10-1553]